MGYESLFERPRQSDQGHRHHDDSENRVRQEDSEIEGADGALAFKRDRADLIMVNEV